MAYSHPKFKLPTVVRYTTLALHLTSWNLVCRQTEDFLTPAEAATAVKLLSFCKLCLRASCFREEALSMVMAAATPLPWKTLAM